MRTRRKKNSNQTQPLKRVNRDTITKGLWPTDQLKRQWESISSLGGGTRFILTCFQGQFLNFSQGKVALEDMSGMFVVNIPRNNHFKEWKCDEG